jgi:hypothetical protein
MISGARSGICATCGSETVRSFDTGESATYGVFVACAMVGCDQYVKRAASEHPRWVAPQRGALS